MEQSIFTTIDYHFETLVQRFLESCYLTTGLSITLIDEWPNENGDREITFCFEGGIVSFVRHLNIARPAPQAVLRGSHVLDTRVEVELQYKDSFAESANDINTVDGGTHLRGICSVLTRSLKD